MWQLTKISVGLIVFHLSSVCVSAQQIPAVEENLKQLKDLSKSFIELPVEKVVAEADIVIDSDANPMVKPGLVNWHADFESACTASKKSGKPVMLFHLLGRLDQRFT